MANWFENNPTKSVVVHTVFVAATTWAVSTFILVDRQLLDVKSQLETQKIITEQYKVKVEVLQKDIENLRHENTEYKTWLEKSEFIIPSIVVPEVQRMREEITSLKSKLGQYDQNIDSVKNLKVGIAFIDLDLDISLTLDDVGIHNNALIYFKKPNSNKSIQLEDVKAGREVHFEKNGKKYKIVFTKVLFIGDIVEFMIIPIV